MDKCSAIRLLMVALLVVGAGCSRSIQVDPKSMAATQLQLAKSHLANGNTELARGLANNALLFDPTMDEAKALLASLPPAPQVVSPAAIAEISRKNSLQYVEMARSYAKAGDEKSAITFLESILKSHPDLPEAKALLAELQGGDKAATTAEPASNAQGASPSGVALPVATTGCRLVKGSEFVGEKKAKVIDAWGPPVQSEAFSLADARFEFGGLATSSERLTKLRYQGGAGLTFMMVGKDDVVAAIYWDGNSSGRFASLPVIADGQHAGLADSADKTWLVIPYADGDGYASVGSSMPCGTGRVIMGAYCPVGAQLAACGQGRVIYFTTRGFGLPPEARKSSKALPLRATDTQALPE